MALNDELALVPKKVNNSGESHEEHSLKDIIEFERYRKQNSDEEATPQIGKLGLPIFRTRIRHGRP